MVARKENRNKTIICKMDLVIVYDMTHVTFTGLFFYKIYLKKDKILFFTNTKDKFLCQVLGE